MVQPFVDISNTINQSRRKGNGAKNKVLAYRRLVQQKVQLTKKKKNEYRITNKNRNETKRNENEPGARPVNMADDVAASCCTARLRIVSAFFRAISAISACTYDNSNKNRFHIEQRCKSKLTRASTVTSSACVSRNFYTK